MMEMLACVKFKHRRKTVERKFQPRCLGTSKRFTNLSVVLDLSISMDRGPVLSTSFFICCPKGDNKHKRRTVSASWDDKAWKPQRGKTVSSRCLVAYSSNLFLCHQRHKSTSISTAYAQKSFNWVKTEFHPSMHAYTLKRKKETRMHEGKRESIQCY
jgi:hypothetical protein